MASPWRRVGFDLDLNLGLLHGFDASELLDLDAWIWTLGRLIWTLGRVPQASAWRSKAKSSSGGASPPGASARLSGLASECRRAEEKVP